MVDYDHRCVQDKLNAPKRLAVTGLSILRLGTMPAYSDLNWSSLLSH